MASTRSLLIEQQMQPLLSSYHVCPSGGDDQLAVDSDFADLVDDDTDLEALVVGRM